MALEEMQMFENELQAKQAKECYALAVERIKTAHPDTPVEKYAEKVWFSVAGVIVH